MKTATRGVCLALPFGLVDPFEMGLDEVRIGDVLHCLPALARFNGYTRKHYSVAQHSVIVARLAAVDHGRTHPVTRAALIHDAAETYTGDLVVPFKQRMPQYQELEEEIDAKVWAAFGLPFDTDREGGLVQQVKRYDRMACILECQRLLFYEHSSPEMRRIIPGEWNQQIGSAHLEAAAPLMKFMSQKRARCLLRKEFTAHGFGKTWCIHGEILEGWRREHPFKRVFSRGLRAFASTFEAREPKQYELS